jgi:hypothetical protein
MLFDVFPVLFSLVITSTPTTNPNTYSCQHFFVTALDGYVNVRSSPQIQTNNIRGVLPTGIPVHIVGRKNHWLQLNAPLSGWLARNQIYRVSCDQGNQLLIKVGLPKIKSLGLKAQNGDQKSAETLIKMSPYMDGIIAETYSHVIVSWASKNPKFFVSLLGRQTLDIRQSALTSLDFGLGLTTSSERSAFETYLKSLETTNIIRRDWQGRNPIYLNQTN